MRRYLAAWARPADSQPAITALSRQHGFLILLLCLLFLNLGFYEAEESSGARINLMVAALLLLNHLAFSFRWPAAVTICLRLADAAWLLLTFATIALNRPR